MLIGGTVLSVVILGAWFPANALYHQHASLASANAQLNELHQQDAALAQERKNLSNSSEIARIAREQYQLVSPGTTPYQVLPPSDAHAPSNSSYATDPGLSKPVVPSGDVELPPGSTSSEKAPSNRRATAPSSFVGRILQTLEFWR